MIIVSCHKVQGKEKLYKTSTHIFFWSLGLWFGFVGNLYAQQQPYVVSSFPRNEAQNLLCNTFVSLTLQFPAEGKTVDPMSLHGNAIKLYEGTNSNFFIPAEISYKKEYRTLTLKPLQVLIPHTEYTFEITHFLVDERGESFAPFKMTFTTGDCVPPEPEIKEPEPEPEVKPDTIPEVITEVEEGPPVPFIDLVGFRAESSRDTVIIKWRTYTEFMIADYTVDRSYDGESFVIIDRIESHGDSEETQYYTWNDLRQTPGPIHYRLTVADIYGELYNSDTISVYMEEIRFTETDIYANGTLSIDFTVQEKTTMAFILRSETNKIVKRKAGAILPGTQRYDIPLEGIPPGRYMAVLQTAEKTIIQQIQILN